MEASLFRFIKVYSGTKEGKEEDTCILILRYNGCFYHPSMRSERFRETLELLKKSAAERGRKAEKKTVKTDNAIAEVRESRYFIGDSLKLERSFLVFILKISYILFRYMIPHINIF